MFLLVEPDPRWRDALAAGMPGDTVAVGDGDGLAARLDSSVRAIVVGPNLPLGDDLDLIRRVRNLQPTARILSLQHAPTPRSRDEAFAAGASDVLTANDLTSLAIALKQQPGSEPPDGTSIIVFSPKGGVGKTTVAANLALALGRAGETTCLVDLDLGFGDIAITLRLRPQQTIVQALPHAHDLGPEEVAGLLTPYDRISVLAAPAHPEGKDRVPPGLVGQIIAALKQQFRYVVIDTSPSFDDQNLHAFDQSEECLLITTMDVPTVKNVRVALNTLDELSFAIGHRRLLLNRADDEVGLSPREVEDVLGLPVSASLPSSTAVATGTNRGRPVVLEHPDHPVSREFARLAQAYLKREPAPGAPVQHRRVFGRRRRT